MGGRPPYGFLYGLTTCFLEGLLFPTRHQKGLLQGKLGGVVITGIEGWRPGAPEVADQLRQALEEKQVEIVGML